jgi:hypothetical protein
LLALPLSLVSTGKNTGFRSLYAMLLAEPGSGPFNGARLKDYSGLPDDLNLLVVVGEDDYVVGAAFGLLVFNTAVNTPNRNFIVQRRAQTTAILTERRSKNITYCSSPR